MSAAPTSTPAADDGERRGRLRPRRSSRRTVGAAPAAAALGLAALAVGAARGQSGHPPVVVRDGDGAPVVSSGGPASPIKTCGGCHDSEWIAGHAYHALVGEGGRHAGGGPAPRAGGEHDCFLCHVRGADAGARARALGAGGAAWAPTATLSGAGVVAREGDAWRWRAGAFDARGATRALGVEPATATHCGACHGRVHEGAAPLPPVGGLDVATDRTGQVFSGQPVADSALNLRGKDELLRPWDVHAARLVDCAGCHVAPNHPRAYREADATRPRHQREDPRGLDPGEFLRRPSHDLTKGDTAQGVVARHLAGSLRSCEGCHDAPSTHAAWLPYAARHTERLRCEACHVPRALVPARAEVDWTLLDPATGEGLVRRRGGPAHDDGGQPALLEGFEPVLLARAERDGRVRLGPYNLVTTWSWAAGDDERPVPVEALRAALLDEGGRDRPEVVDALDRDGDGRLTLDERRLDTEARVAAVRARLVAAGVAAPRLVGQVQPYGLHHGVATGRYALRECDACHAPGGRLDRPFVLSPAPPPGVTPVVASDAGLPLPRLELDARGALVVRPSTAAAGAWVVGHDRAPVVDALGAAALLLTLVAAAAHGAGRVAAARRRGV